MSSHVSDVDLIEILLEIQAQYFPCQMFRNWYTRISTKIVVSRCNKIQKKSKWELGDSQTKRTISYENGYKEGEKGRVGGGRVNTSHGFSLYER